MSDNKGVIISETMSDEQLLKSIDDVLKRGEAKFTNFASDVNGTLSSIGATLGDSMNKSLTGKLDEANRKIREMETKLKGTGTSTAALPTSPVSPSTINVNDMQMALSEQQSISNLKQMKGQVDAYRQSLKEGSDELRTANGIYSQIQVKIKDALSLQATSSLKTAYAMPVNDLSQMEAKLRSLQGIQQSLQGKSVLSIPEMQRLNTQVDNLSRKMEAIRGKSGTMGISQGDISSVLGMSEANLNSISAKMKSISELRGNASLNSTDLSRLNKEYQRLSESQSKALTSGTELKTHNNSLATSFENLSKRVIFYAGLGAITGFVRQLYEVRGEYEMLERSMGALLGNFAKGSELFNQIQTQALKSPFTVIDLAGAAKQLVAYDFAEKDVADTTRRMADIASALGVPIERLIYNLGQIKAQGVLNARDARDFANAGFAIVPMLTKMYNESGKFNGQMVTTAQVYEMMTKKMVSYADVMSVIKSATNSGGMFFDFQAKQASTLKGQLSNLTDAWNLMLNQMGEANQGVLTGTVDITRKMLANWKDIENIIGTLIISYGTYKAIMLALNATIGRGNLFLTQSIEISKAKRVADLKNQALTRELTDAETAYIAVRSKVTAADYSAALASKNLSESQAMLLVSFNRNNKELVSAVRKSRLLSKAQMELAMTGNRMQMLMGALGGSLRLLGTSMASFVMTNLPMIAITALIGGITWLTSTIKKNREEAEALVKEYSDMKKSLGDIDINIAVASKTGDIEKEKSGLREMADLAKEKFNIVFDVDTSLLDPKKVSDKILEIRNAIQDAMATGQVFEGALQGDATKAFQSMGKDASQLYAYIQSNMAGVVNILEKKKELKTITEDENKSLNLLLSTYGKAYDKSNLDNIVAAFKEIGLIQKPVEKTYAMYAPPVKTYDNISKAAKDFGATNTSVIVNIVRAWEKLQESQDKAKKSYDDFANRVGKEIDFKLLTPEQTGAKVKVGIDRIASKTEADAYTREMMYYWSGKTFNVNIVPVTKTDGSSKQQLTGWAKSVQDRINKERKGISVIPNEGETQSQFASRMGAEAKTAQDELDAMNNAKSKGVAYTKEEIKTQQELIDKYKLIAKYAGYANAKENAKGISAEANAIKEESDLISKLTSNYEKLSKAGYVSADAVNMLTEEYKSSIGQINATLSKSGLPTFDVSKFAGKDVSAQLSYFTALRDAMKSKGLDKLKPDAFKEVSTNIMKLTVDAKTYDISQITSGLKDSIAGIKDKFEIGSEITANPKFGKIFENIFNIKGSDMISTAEQAVDEIGRAISKSIDEYNEKNKTALPGIDLLSTDFKKWAQENGMDYKSDFIQGLVEAQKYATDVVKKSAEEDIKSWDGLLSKYAEYEYKRKEIQKNAAQERLGLVRRFGTEEDKAQAADLLNKIQISDDPEKIAELQEQLKTLVDKVVSGNKTGVAIATSITSGSAQQTTSMDVEEFKKTKYWVAAFSELDNLSSKSIKDIIAKMEEFKDAQKDMSPTEIKEFNKAIENLRNTFVSRNPFTAINEGLKESEAAYKKVKPAQDKYTDAVNKFGSNSQEAKKAQENLFDANNEYTQSLNKTKTAALSVISTVNDMATGFQPLTDALDETGKVALQSMISVAKTAVAVAFAIKTAEKSSVILAIIQAALVAVTTIYSFIDVESQKSEESIKALSGQVDYLKGQLDKLNIELFKDPNKLATYQNELSDRVALARMNITQMSEELSKFNDSLKYNEKEMISNMLTGGSIGYTNLIAQLKNGDMGKAWQEFLGGISVAVSNTFKVIFNQKAIKNLEYGQKLYNVQLEYSSKLLSIMGSNMGIMQKDAEANIANYEMQNQRILAKIEENKKKKSGKRDFDKETELWDSYYANEAKKSQQYAQEIKDNYGDLFNDLSQDITDAFRKAFENGTSYSDVFKDSWEKAVSDVIWNIFKIQKIMPLIQELMKGYYKAMGLNEDGTVPKGTTPDLTITPEEAKELKGSYDKLSEEGKAAYDAFKALLSAIGLTPGSSSSQASSLQQGIQSMSEDTGGAIEAYMNNISGQVFLQNTYLQQMSLQLDSITALSSQTVHHLQSSYQVQLSIRDMMLGWSVPNGQGVKVKLI